MLLFEKIGFFSACSYTKLLGFIHYDPCIFCTLIRLNSPYCLLSVPFVFQCNPSPQNLFFHVVDCFLVLCLEQILKSEKRYDIFFSTSGPMISWKYKNSFLWLNFIMYITTFKNLFICLWSPVSVLYAG